MKKNQVSQVKEFSTFPCMGRHKSLGSLNSFLSCTSQRPGASTLRYERHVLRFSRAAHTWQAQEFTFEGPSGCWLWQPRLLTRQETLHSSVLSLSVPAPRTYRSWTWFLEGRGHRCPWTLHGGRSSPQPSAQTRNHQGPTEGSPSPGGQQGGGPSIPRAAGKLKPSLRPHRSSESPSAQPCPRPWPLCRQIRAATSRPASWGISVAATTQ